MDYGEKLEATRWEAARDLKNGKMIHTKRLVASARASFQEETPSAEALAVAVWSIAQMSPKETMQCLVVETLAAWLRTEQAKGGSDAASS